MVKKFFPVINDDSGATSIEYGLIGVLISITVLFSLQSIANSILLPFGIVVENINN